MDKPECVIKCGGALVNLRHFLEKAGDLFDKVDAELTASEPEMKKRGWKKMQYAEARIHLLEARKAAFHIMMAHDSLRKSLKECGIAEPTDDDLIGIVGRANFR